MLAWNFINIELRRLLIMKKMNVIVVLFTLCISLGICQVLKTEASESVTVNWIDHDEYDTTVATGPAVGRYVKVNLEAQTWLSLAEVEVFDESGTNIALSGTATQSSLAYSGVPYLRISPILSVASPNSYTMK